MPPDSHQGSFRAVLRRTRVLPVLRFLSVALVLGWFYGWAEPRFYPKDKRVGFGYGMMHGALMPMALPALVMAQDVSIYHDYNTGRTYKLGYIVGINLCGLVVFGSLFWRPARSGDPKTEISRKERKETQRGGAATKLRRDELRESPSDKWGSCNSPLR